MVNDGLIFVVNAALKIMVKAGLTDAAARHAARRNQQLKSRVMALREIVVLPDKQLRLVSKPVEKVTTEIRKLADMFETMYDAPGIGLAAIQVAQPLRLITMDLAKKDENGETKPKPRSLASIRKSSLRPRELFGLRGGLSLDPETTRRSSVPAKFHIRFTDLDGKVHEEDTDGLFATCTRDRPSQRRAVRRLCVEAEARDRVIEEVYKSRQTRGGVGRHSAQPSCPGLSRASTSFLTAAEHGWPGAQTSVRSLREADYYARP